MLTTADRPTPVRGPIYDRRTVLGQLADGQHPKIVHGPARAAAAHELKGYLVSIRLTETETLHRTLAATRELERRHAAYRNGVRFLHSAYYEYGLTTGPEGDLR